MMKNSKKQYKSVFKRKLKFVKQRNKQISNCSVKEKNSKNVKGKQKRNYVNLSRPEIPNESKCTEKLKLSLLKLEKLS